MKLSIFAYSRRGCQTAGRVLSCLSQCEGTIYVPQRLAGGELMSMTRPYEEFYGPLFSGSDILVFVGAAGIAVRSIAPHVRDKRLDPAVICVDELGRFVISLLSGHIGGANALTQRLADELGATAVITTATDINSRFSADAWAAENGYVIGSMSAAKAVSAAILEGDVPLLCDLPISGELPPGLVPGEDGETGVYIGWSLKKPFKNTLQLIPKVLHLGIGCRRGTDSAAIAAAVGRVFEENGIDPRAVCRAATIDLKADEPGLLSYCEQAELPLSVYSAGQLAQVKGEFTPSAFVESVTGVDNVCERAALAEADMLIVRKNAVNGVTVAVAAKNTEVRFG